MQAYPEFEEKQLRWACDLQYEIARAELAIIVQHNAKQFMWTWAARSKEEFHKGATDDFYPHGYTIVGNCRHRRLSSLSMKRKY